MSIEEFEKQLEKIENRMETAEKVRKTENGD